MKRASLKKRAIRGSFWTISGYGASQALRFGGNIVLTRLLFPEDFGLMVYVNVTLAGLAMFSDLGLGPSIIQNPRGEEESFLRTAWTLQIARGLILWVCASMLAWPVGQFYNEPSLIYYLPVAGSTVLITSFATTNLFLANRRIQLGRVAVIEFVGQCFGLVGMIVLAFTYRNVWALVAGAIISSCTKAILSHILMPHPRMGFEFDRSAAGELFRFGKWIFLATVLGFIVNQADRLVLGKFMTTGELGIYDIALTLSGVMMVVTRRMNTSVLFPVYAETARENPKKLRAQTFRVRRTLMLVTVPPTLLLIIFAQHFVDFVYPENYSAMGWMIPIIGMGVILNCITVPIGSIFIASGDSGRHLLNLIARTFVLLPATIIGGYFWGAVGIMFAFAIAPVLHYPLMIYLIRPYRVWLPALDFAAVAIASTIAGIGLWLTHL